MIGMKFDDSRSTACAYHKILNKAFVNAASLVLRPRAKLPIARETALILGGDILS